MTKHSVSIRSICIKYMVWQYPILLEYVEKIVVFNALLPRVA